LPELQYHSLSKTTAFADLSTITDFFVCGINTMYQSASNSGSQPSTPTGPTRQTMPMANTSYTIYCSAAIATIKLAQKMQPWFFASSEYQTRLTRVYLASFFSTAAR